MKRVHRRLAGHTLFACALALGLFALNAQADIHYVATNGLAQTPFTNWTDAATVIQDAVDVASNGDTVLVSNGVYSTGGRAMLGLQLTNRVMIAKPIALQSVNGPSNTFIVGSGIFNDNTNICRCLYLTNGASLAGFTLTNGCTYYSGFGLGYSEDQMGGGIWCEGLDAIVSNCVITGNSADSAGGVEYGTLIDCLIVGNYADYYGGGLADSTATNCYIAFNQAERRWGGGAYQGDLWNCSLFTNSAWNGGGMSKTTAKNCGISNNSARNTGGGAYLGTIEDSVFENNTAQFGGHMSESTVRRSVLRGGLSWASSGVGGGGATHLGNATDCLIVSNYSRQPGGGTYETIVSNSTVCFNHCYWEGAGCAYGSVYDSLIYGNVSSNNGGGAYRCSTIQRCQIYSNRAYTGGGVFYTSGDAGNIRHSVIRNNYAKNYGGGASQGAYFNCTIVSNSASSAGGTYFGYFTNCIIYFNAVVSNYPDCHTNSRVSYSCTPTPPPGSVGCITDNPLFVDLNGSDLHLLTNSPCLDIGTNGWWTTNTVDLEGRPRVLNGIVDLGAYELIPPSWDSNTNGMPDWWEWQYSRSLTGMTATADNDSDFFQNLHEYIAGTSPTNSSSFLKLQTILAAAPTGVVVSWASVTGKSYRVERGNQMTDTYSYVVASNIVAVAATSSCTDSTGVLNLRLYRVEVEH